MENVFWLKEPTRTPQRDERHRLVSAKWVMGLIAPSAVREACSMGTKPNDNTSHAKFHHPNEKRRVRWRGAHSQPRSLAHISFLDQGAPPLPVCATGDRAPGGV